MCTAVNAAKAVTLTVQKITKTTCSFKLLRDPRSYQSDGHALTDSLPSGGDHTADDARPGSKGGRPISRMFLLSQRLAFK